MKRLNFLFCLIFLTITSSSFAQDRGRNEFSLGLDTHLSYGSTDRTDVFFSNPTTDLQVASYGTRIGIEAVMPKRFGFRLLGGYERNFYSNKAASTIIKNIYTVDLLFSYFFKSTVHRWDPYLIVGPAIRFGTSGAQGYLNTGFGFRYFFNDHWSLRLEPSFMTDFTGGWGKFSTGVNLHF